MVFPKGERGDEAPIKIDAQAGGTATATVSTVGLKNLTSCTVKAEGGVWAVTEVAVTETATGNIWVFAGKDVEGSAVLSTANMYTYKGAPVKAADKEAAVKLFKASFQSKLVRRVVASKKAERDKSIASILNNTAVPTDAAGLAKEVNSITEKFADIEKNNTKIKSENAELQKKIAAAEEETASQKKKLEEELKSMKSDLEKALEEAKKAKEAADKANAEAEAAAKKKSSVCTIL